MAGGFAIAPADPGGRAMRLFTGALFVLLAFGGPAIAQPEAASGHRCAPDVLAGLSGWDGSGLKQIATDADERVLLAPDPEMIEFDAGDGDDVVYIPAPPAGRRSRQGRGRMRSSCAP